MNDSEFKHLVARVRRAAGKWHRALGLGTWKVIYVYDREGTLENRKAQGECTSDWRYKEARITINMPRVAGLTDGELEQLVVHEQVHALVNEMHEATDEGRAHEERVVSDLTAAFFWVAEGLWGKPLAAPKKVLD